MLIEEINTNYPEYKAVYSTPSKYIDALHKQGIEYPVHYDDMFPYTEEGLSYWGGYYSSRPWIKQSVKTMSQTFHAANNLFAFNFLNEKKSDEKEKIEEAIYNGMNGIGIM